VCGANIDAETFTRDLAAAARLNTDGEHPLVAGDVTQADRSR
jgi:hypothetical protein